MTHEEAARILDPDTTAKVLREYGDGNAQIAACDEACRIAADVLRNKQTGEPLTMEQLREMDGKPVWVKDLEKTERSGWRLIYWDRGKYMVLLSKSVEGYILEEYGKTWLAYTYPPAHIDREAWEKPCSMCGGKTTLYQHTNTTKLFMNTFGNAATLVTECMACPPYADCCMKGISANSAFKINFCPECGRPLTGKARAEREKRMGVRA